MEQKELIEKLNKLSDLISEAKKLFCEIEPSLQQTDSRYEITIRELVRKSTHKASRTLIIERCEHNEIYTVGELILNYYPSLLKKKTRLGNTSIRVLKECLSQIGIEWK